MWLYVGLHCPACSVQYAVSDAGCIHQPVTLITPPPSHTYMLAHVFAAKGRFGRGSDNSCMLFETIYNMRQPWSRLLESLHLD